MNSAHGSYAREHPRAWIDRAPENLPQGWIDDMVRRLLEECNRQLIKLENASKNASDKQDEPRLREQNARVLAALRREFREALVMEDDRAVKRDTRTAQDAHDAVAALERRLDQLLERERAAGPPVEPGAKRSGQAR